MDTDLGHHGVIILHCFLVLFKLGLFSFDFIIRTLNSLFTFFFDFFFFN